MRWSSSHAMKICGPISAMPAVYASSRNLQSRKRSSRCLSVSNSSCLRFDRAPNSVRNEPMTKKAILLAGGAGTRLFPLTTIVCKQLLPVYDKPMICYPLATLMLGGLRKILIISTPKDLPMLREFLGDGSRFGIELEYAEQPKPEGIAQAFLIGAKFVGVAGASLILGDNIFYGKLDFYREALALERGACIFGYQVQDPQRYGVVEFDNAGKAISLEEKPKHPRSQFAVPGLYIFYDRVVEFCRELKPSGRGEIEITDLNLQYLKRGDPLERQRTRLNSRPNTARMPSRLEPIN